MKKIFAHRGFVLPGIEQNSIASLHEAHKRKFVGVEFDVWLIDNELVLSHDFPEVARVNKLPKLSDYFHFKNDFEYWIDFKNLNETNVDKACQIIKKEIIAAGIDIKKIYFAPFITDKTLAESVWKGIEEHFANAQIMAVCEKILPQEFEIYHDWLKKCGIKFLSIAHENISVEFLRIFHDIEIFAWTVNDQKRLRQLVKIGVKNFTSDNLY